MKEIKPTVGRVVLYIPQKHEGFTVLDDQPCAATIAHVDENGVFCNLTVHDHIGVVHSLRNIPLVQGTIDKPTGGGYCEWMPYQIGQAAKSDDLLKQLEARLMDLELDAGWKVQAPRPSVTEIEKLMAEHGERNVRLATNGDVMVRGS